MSTRVDRGIGHVIVREVRVVGMSIEGELQDACAGHAEPVSKCVYIGCDQPEVFGNERQSRDVARLLSAFSSHYIPHPLGEIGIGTTALDEGGRWEEDLTAIPDIVAGALAETTTRLAEHCGGHIPATIAVPYEDPLLAKADFIARWFWSHGPTLRRVAILFGKQPDGGYAVLRHEMVAG